MTQSQSQISQTHSDVYPMCEGEQGCGQIFQYKTSPGLCCKCKFITDTTMHPDLIIQRQKYGQCQGCGAASLSMPETCGVCKAKGEPLNQGYKNPHYKLAQAQLSVSMNLGADDSMPPPPGICRCCCFSNLTLSHSSNYSRSEHCRNQSTACKGVGQQEVSKQEQ